MAVVAAVALGTTIVKKVSGFTWTLTPAIPFMKSKVLCRCHIVVLLQSKSKKEEPREESNSFLEGAGKSLRSTQRWFGEKAESAKDKAGKLAPASHPCICTHCK